MRVSSQLNSRTGYRTRWISAKSYLFASTWRMIQAENAPTAGRRIRSASQPDRNGRNRMANEPECPATQRIGILVFDGFEPIDVFGFAEAFAIARFLGQGYAAKPPYPF